MKHLKNLHLLFALAVMCGLFFNITPATQGFSVEDFGNMLVKVVDKPRWRIGYAFVVGCRVDFRKEETKLKEFIVKALQTLLQPLRERYPDRRFTDDFLLVRLPDAPNLPGVAGCKLKQQHGLDVDLDLYIVFYCKSGVSYAYMSRKVIPCVCIRSDNISHIPYLLVHEIEHTFGLLDTYLLGDSVSTGGLALTKGKQPSSVMAGFSNGTKFQIREDDKNGILHNYKVWHEGHSIRDCFFPDYGPGEGMSECEPKYPLIFEVKHGGDLNHFSHFERKNTVEMILRDDPTLDINAQDASGFTALHHAVQRGNIKIVKTLLAQAGIKVNLLNTHKRTPAQLARTLKQIHLAKMIEAHRTANWEPVAWNVAPKRKLTTTWGHLKKKY